MSGGKYTTLTVYSSTWCADCRVAKRFLDDNGISYKLIEIDKDEAAAILLEEKTGKRGVPYFVFDEKDWVRAYVPRQGFDRDGMKEIFGV